MKTISLFSIGAALLFSGCYCEHYATYSSVRHLEGTRSWDICHLPPALEKGKSTMLTPFYGDTKLTAYQFGMSDTNKITTETDYKSDGIFGLQMRRYFILGKFPGPLLGIGMNYSRNDFTANYYTVKHFIHEHQDFSAKQQRFHFTLDWVTWLRPQFMGSFNFAVGKVWSKRKIDSEFAQYDYEDKKAVSNFDWRISYGLQFYLKPTLALQLDLGYGGGSLARVGVNWWVR